MGSEGIASGGADVLAAFESSLKEVRLNAQLGNKCVSHKVGCMGLCSKDVLVDVIIDGRKTTYEHVTPAKVRRIVSEHIINGNAVSEWLADSLYDSFYTKQVRVALLSCGEVDPGSVISYFETGGYRALKKALTNMTPDDVINEIERSGLRGRGGSGFPTAEKWRICRESAAVQKYIICTADETDPDAHKDSALLEGNPHLIIEGIIIGAYSIGADKGYIYVRAGRKHVLERMRHAIEEARMHGFIGSNILGSGFNFDVGVGFVADASISGEETYLIAPIEGRSDMPNPRTLSLIERGLWGKSIITNNVETLANVPPILLRSAEWHSSICKEKSGGAKIFTLSGKLRNRGLIEVPMGITLGEIIYEIGAGIRGGKKLKAVHIGGQAGGCIPANMIDIRIDHESLARAGAGMGSSSLTALDENSCMVNMARNAAASALSESCGRCVSCRPGTEKLLEILDGITTGHGRDGDVELLESLSLDINSKALCGFGRSASNFVLSSLKYFRKEYEEHIRDKRCRALECKEIISSACRHTCPIGSEPYVYMALIAQGRFEEAAQIIRMDNPLASVCARICHHPCEAACSAGETGNPIAIRALKRFAMDHARKMGVTFDIKKKPCKGKKIAIIGSGPSGLTAGYFLALRGYDVAIFEGKSFIGGMLRVAIPQHRLPGDALDNDIRFIKESGVRFITDLALGKDFSIDDLFAGGYEAVFLAIGACRPKKLNLDGESVKGVVPSLQFLNAVNLGKEMAIGEKVVVIGGGSSAIDSARAAWRSKGVKNVTLVYRNAECEMPACRDEVVAAHEEGINMHFLTDILRILACDGFVTGIECARMKPAGLYSAQRRLPVPIKGSEFSLGADTLIISAGEQPDLSCVEDSVLSEDCRLSIDPLTFATRRKGVFAGGEVVTGANNMINSMRAGKRAAASIDAYLMGNDMDPAHKTLRPSRFIEPVALTDEELMGAKRPEMPSLPAEERIGGFMEVELGFSRDMAVKEACRCLRCDLKTRAGQQALCGMRIKNPAKSRPGIP